jgi:hypothetical protein
MLPEYATNKNEYWQIVDANWTDLYNILVTYLPKEELATADNLRINQDRELSSLFENAWFAAPDHPHIHNIPGWHILCNLCSEAHVLWEDGELLNK